MKNLLNIKLMSETNNNEGDQGMDASYGEQDLSKQLMEAFEEINNAEAN